MSATVDRKGKARMPPELLNEWIALAYLLFDEGIIVERDRFLEAIQEALDKRKPANDETTLINPDF